MSATTNVLGPAAQTERTRRAWYLLSLLSAGHFAVDLYSGSLGALQPRLVEHYGLSLADAGMLGGVLMASASLMQPVYGYISDRIPSRIFAGLGPAVAAVFIASLGIAHGFGGLLLMVALGGAGVAAFHPQASSRAVAGIEKHRGRAMAIFISAGTLGTAAGPTYFAGVTSWLGLENMYWAAIPGMIVGALLFPALANVYDVPRKSSEKSGWRALHEVRKPLAILFTLVFLRSVVQGVFGQFIPLYLHLERGYSLTAASIVLSLFMGFGAIGGLTGGHLADRFGGRRVIIVSMIASVPFLATFFLATGWISIAGLLLGGLIMLFTIPVNVLMAQDLAPSEAGTVSALMMGFAYGTSGLIFVPLTGWAADVFSLHHALFALVALPVLGFFLSLRLPK
jgi:FSR family fosmidomycin resistance protein-like MFS transporter